MWPDIIPHPFSLLNPFLHYRQQGTDIALLVELSFIGFVGNFHVGILLRGPGIDKVMGNPFFLTELVKLFQESGAVICLDCLDREGKSQQAFFKKLSSIPRGLGRIYPHYLSLA